MKDESTSVSVGVMCVRTGPTITGFESGKRRGAMNQGVQVAYKNWKMQGNRCTSRACRKNRSPVDTLILAQLDSYWASNLQNYKIIKLSCFKPLGW